MKKSERMTKPPMRHAGEISHSSFGFDHFLGPGHSTTYTNQVHGPAGRVKAEGGFPGNSK